MDDSSWLFSETDMSRFALPYPLGLEALPPYSYPTYPDGALKTTVTDYGRFVRSLMSSAQGSGGLLSKAGIEEMLTAQPADAMQALTWRYQPLDEIGVDFLGVQPDTVGHTGGDPGILSFVLWNPRTRGAVILFMNSTLERDESALPLLEVLKEAIAVAGV